jgi:hypothetical protein
MDYRPSWNLRSIPDDVFFSQPGRHAAMRVNLGGLREGAGRKAIIVPCPHAGSRKRRRKRDGATDARASAYGRVGRPLRTFAGFSDAACVIARSCRCALNADRLRLHSLCRRGVTVRLKTPTTDSRHRRDPVYLARCAVQVIKGETVSAARPEWPARPNRE